MTRFFAILTLLLSQTNVFAIQSDTLNLEEDATHHNLDIHDDSAGLSTVTGWSQFDTWLYGGG